MNFPDEILNLIFSFRGPHPIALILKPEIEKWKKDYSHFCYFFTFKKNEYMIVNRNLKLKKWNEKFCYLDKKGYYGGGKGDIY
jgi:hypothetical protein